MKTTHKLFASIRLEKKLAERNFVIQTPDKKKKKREKIIRRPYQPLMYRPLYQSSTSTHSEIRTGDGRVLYTEPTPRVKFGKSKICLGNSIILHICQGVLVLWCSLFFSANSPKIWRKWSEWGRSSNTPTSSTNPSARASKRYLDSLSISLHIYIHIYVCVTFSVTIPDLGMYASRLISTSIPHPVLLLNLLRSDCTHLGYWPRAERTS